MTDKNRKNEFFAPSKKEARSIEAPQKAVSIPTGIKGLECTMRQLGVTDMGDAQEILDSILKHQQIYRKVISCVFLIIAITLVVGLGVGDFFNTSTSSVSATTPAVGKGTFSNPLKFRDATFMDVLASSQRPTGYEIFNKEGRVNFSKNIAVMETSNQWVIGTRSIKADGSDDWSALSIDKPRPDAKFPSGPWLTVTAEVKMLHIPDYGWVCVIGDKVFVLKGVTGQHPNTKK